VRNNPLNAIDPDGRETCYYNGDQVLACEGDKKRIARIDYENNLIYIKDKKGRETPYTLDARFIVRGYQEPAQQLVQELGRYTPALERFTTVGGAIAVAVPTAIVAAGAIGGSALTQLSLQGAKEILRYGSKQAAREAIEQMGLSEAAKQAALRAIARGGANQVYQLIEREGGGVIVRILRPGRDGYQVIESIIDQVGNKQVIQKAVDALGKLVHYDPK
jgi:hypothetical protein